MISHGITTGALFLLVGVIYERTHDRLIAHMGGLNSRLPRYAAIFGLFTFASIGLPGLSGFVGEFLVMLGAFQYNGWVAAAAMIVVIISAVYMLWMFQRVFFTVPSGWMRRWWPSLHGHEPPGMGGARAADHPGGGAGRVPRPVAGHDPGAGRQDHRAGLALAGLTSLSLTVVRRSAGHG